ncbi:MAG TPA: tyrosine-type recombinase/integrase [Candidatus Doudnabacteria bacterium]|nr:tyrosine-type recombinase/integrase [Candidatus Doudnabacteria bacterium]
MAETKTKSKIEKYIQDFLEYCEIERNKSDLTVRNYAHYLARFSAFAKANSINRPEDIVLDTVRAYRLFLNRLESNKGKRLKLATQNYHVIALRAFLKYLAKRDVDTLSAEKIELAKSPSREVSVMTPEEVIRIKAATKEEKNEMNRLRDTAILEMLFSSGIRISELVQLKISQLNFKSGEFTVRGKGDKLRLAFMSEDAIKALQIYLKKRHDNNPALFVSHSKIGNSIEKQMESVGGSSKVPGLTARSVQRLVQKYAMLAGIMHKVTPHTFRHSFATDLLQNGADIRSVQTLLGHASITTTQIYTHVTNQQLRDVHKKFHNKK